MQNEKAGKLSHVFQEKRLVGSESRNHRSPTLSSTRTSTQLQSPSYLEMHFSEGSLVNSESRATSSNDEHAPRSRREGLSTFSNWPLFSRRRYRSFLGSSAGDMSSSEIPTLRDRRRSFLESETISTVIAQEELDLLKCHLRDAGCSRLFLTRLSKPTQMEKKNLRSWNSTEKPRE